MNTWWEAYKQGDIDVLWFCDKTKWEMADRIQRAIQWYEEKYSYPVRVVRCSLKDHTDLGEAEFYSAIDNEQIIVVWNKNVPKSHIRLSCKNLFTSKELRNAHLT